VKENCLPASIVPEFHPAPSDVDVCGTESVFVQVTVVPAVTLSSSGAYARFAREAAPAGTLTDDDDPAADGVADDGFGDVGEA
jgi:hypothetical protein